MEFSIKRHRRNVSYEDAANLFEFWELAERFDRSFYREYRNHWDERGFDEYIIAAEGYLPYCETPEQYVCRMETREEILAVLALCTENSRNGFYSTLYMIFLLRKLLKFVAALRALYRHLLMLSEKFFKNFGNRHIR